MTDVQAAAYAAAVAKLLHAHGPTPRERLLAGCLAFGLSEEQANTIVERGLALSLYVVDPATGHLRAPQLLRREPTAFLGDGIIDARKDPDVARRLAILRVLLSTAPVAMWAVDQAGYIIYYEGKALEGLGLQDGQFVGQSFHEVFGEHACAPYVARAFNGEIVEVSWEYGGIIWQNWCFPLKNAGGEVELVSLVSMDVTEARHAEQELRERLTTIERQQRVISELSTPIIEVWDKVLALPLLGVVDSTRAAMVMTNLLAEVVNKASQFVLLDLTGVEAVDTATAGYMLDLLRAVRLLGAEGIITGIRPSVAQTMVTLGVDLGNIVTHATLRQGLQHCLRGLRQGRT
ncbi:STAS domain-containing protein [Polyangium sp. 6x1]|uniref:STAS domain-containing protein n=1 Tax=Polyangium sp. 6x1 TaxID=3042689 RepID=UPI0024824197|nr:STAS domain-containing protein [Polyangium sp. 6x1]MDI1446672.1 STAS domain-containing protein [Polyangium sp. 6x1]